MSREVASIRFRCDRAGCKATVEQSDTEALPEGWTQFHVPPEIEHGGYVTLCEQCAQELRRWWRAKEGG